MSDKQSWIELFAINLYLAADYLAKGMHDLLAESKSLSSNESVNAKPESTAEGATIEYNGLVYPKRLNSPPSESKSSSSNKSVNAKPESTAEGATMEYNGLVYPKRLNGPPLESKSLNSNGSVDTKPKSTAEGATTELNMLAYLDGFIVNIRQLSVAGRLLVKSTGHRFSVDSLETLTLNKSLSINIITASLHLFTKLPNV